LIEFYQFERTVGSLLSVREYTTARWVVERDSGQSESDAL